MKKKRNFISKSWILLNAIYDIYKNTFMFLLDRICNRKGNKMKMEKLKMKLNFNKFVHKFYWTQNKLFTGNM